jgi:hypothetical protein
MNEQVKEDLKNQIATVKKQLYKEEALSALFALAFGSNIAALVIEPFTFLSFINILFALYVFGFFKPTIKKQEKLHLVLKGLKDMLQKAENPPKQEKPAAPWSSK